MESRINYSLVGAFVLLLTAVTAYFAYWLAIGGESRQYACYMVYATDSVTGLSVNSRVYYHGMDVGAVAEMWIDPDQPERIAIRLLVDEETPIRADTLAQLRAQGITGLSMLNLSGGAPDSPLLPAADDGHCPEVQYQSSLFSRLEGGLDDTLVHISLIGKRLERLISEENIDHLHRVFSDASKITASLAAQRQGIGEIIDNSRRITANVAQLSESADGLMSRAVDSMDSVDQALAQFEQTLQSFEHSAEEVSRAAAATVDFSAAGARAATHLDQHTMPEVELLFADLRHLIRRVENLTEKLANDPSQVLFGAPRRPPGPGEEP